MVQQAVSAAQQARQMPSIEAALAEGTAAKTELEREIDQILETYEEVMRERRKREDEIEDAYALVADRKAVGTYPGAADLCSELMMSNVDQATARIAGKLIDAKPIMKVEALDTISDRDPWLASGAQKLAKAIERFLENYGRRALKVSDRLREIAHRGSKVGTAVVNKAWIEKVRPLVRPSMIPGGPPTVTPRREKRVRWRLIANRDVVIWPPWEGDWHEDFDLVGHRDHKTILQFKEWAKRQKFTPAEIEELVSRAVAPSDAKMKAAEAQGQKLNAAANDKLTGVVPLYELWLNREIEPFGFPVVFRVFYSRETKKLYKPLLNPNASGRHNYYPIRYKRIDQNAWGNGIGHELYTAHVADTAYRNIEVDSILSTAFQILLVKANSQAESQTEQPYPGQRVVTENLEEDITTLSMAGDAGAIEIIYRAIEANQRRSHDASGLSPVLAGQGDPTMKSGGGTGSTIALIEEAGRKFGEVDNTMRSDLSELYAATLNDIVQYGDEALFRRYAAPEDVALLLTLKQMPPGASVEDYFSIVVAAPSASTNREVQKNQALATWNFILQTSQACLGLAQQIFPQMNPAGLVSYMVQWCEALRSTGQEVIDLHELPGMRELLPKLPLQQDPKDQQINFLMQQLQSLNEQLAQLQGMAPGGGEGPPNQSGGAEGGGAPMPPPGA